MLGTKYLDLHTGTSHQVISDGGLLPLGQTHVPVQFDDVFKTFDPKTRVAVQDSLTGAGDALTARGSALNDTIASLPPLLTHLQPVAKYLSDPSTNLTGFFDNLERFMGAVAPVAHGERGSVWADGDDVCGDRQGAQQLAGDDREVAVDRGGVDAVVEGSAAVPGRSDDVWQGDDARDRVAQRGAAGVRARDRGRDTRPCRGRLR